MKIKDKFVTPNRLADKDFNAYWLSQVTWAYAATRNEDNDDHDGKIPQR